MNILIIEDSEERIDFFKNLYRSHSINISEDLEEIIELLQSTDINLIHLDFDLTEGNTIQIAKYIKMQILNLPIIIHSDNQSGIVILKEILQNAIVIPFSSFIKKDSKMSKYKSLLSSGVDIWDSDIKVIFST